MAERRMTTDLPARPKAEARRTAAEITDLLDAAMEGRVTAPPAEGTDIPQPKPAPPRADEGVADGDAQRPATLAPSQPTSDPAPSRWRASGGSSIPKAGPQPQAQPHDPHGLWQGVLLGMWIMGQRLRDMVVHPPSDPAQDTGPAAAADGPEAPRRGFERKGMQDPVDDPAGPRLLPLAPKLLHRGLRRHGYEQEDGGGAGAAPADDREEEHKGGRKWLWIALALLALGILGAVALYVLRPKPEGRTPPPQAPFVETTRVEAGDGALIVTGNGVVRPRAEIGLSPQVPGRVEYVNPALQSGGRFAEGEVLVRLDAADYRNQVEQARAEVAQREVELERARQERQIAVEEYRRLQVRLGRDDLTGATAEVPFEGDFTADGRPMDITGGTGSPPGADRGAASGGDAGVSPLTLREPQFQAAQAALDAARARLDDAVLALNRTVIDAPFAGRVRSEDVDIGQYVATGEQLARIYSDDAVEVVVPLTNDRAALIPRLWDLSAAGDSARVKALVTTDYGGQRFGWVGYVDRARGDIDPQTRTVDVVVRVPRPFEPGQPVEDGELVPGGRRVVDGDQAEPPLLVGAFTTVRIEGRRPDDYAVIPAKALRNGDEVWILTRGPDQPEERQEAEGGQDGGQRAEPRWTLNIVQVGVIQRADEVAYVRGLEPGARIVINDIQAVSDGMAVRTRTEEELQGSGSGGDGG